jgi:hypothetical protein
MKLWVRVIAARDRLPLAGANRLRTWPSTTFLAGVMSWTLRQDYEQHDDYGRDDRRSQRAAQR